MKDSGCGKTSSNLESLVVSKEGKELGRESWWEETLMEGKEKKDKQVAFTWEQVMEAGMIETGDMRGKFGGDVVLVGEKEMGIGGGEERGRPLKAFSSGNCTWRSEAPNVVMSGPRLCLASALVVTARSMVGYPVRKTD
jgi:hypothetical protein